VAEVAPGQGLLLPGYVTPGPLGVADPVEKLAAALFPIASFHLPFAPFQLIGDVPDQDPVPDKGGPLHLVGLHQRDVDRLPVPEGQQQVQAVLRGDHPPAVGHNHAATVVATEVPDRHCPHPATLGREILGAEDIRGGEETVHLLGPEGEGRLQPGDVGSQGPEPGVADRNELVEDQEIDDRDQCGSPERRLDHPPDGDAIGVHRHQLQIGGEIGVGVEGADQYRHGEGQGEQGGEGEDDRLDHDLHSQAASTESVDQGGEVVEQQQPGERNQPPEERGDEGAQDMARQQAHGGPVVAGAGGA
jgi:hypothetical protein